MIKSTSEKIIFIKGAGEQASGVAIRLWRCGFRIVMSELPQPLTIRRTVAFSEAIYEAKTRVEEAGAQRAENVKQIYRCWDQDILPVVPDPHASLIPQINPAVIIDAILAKFNTGTAIQDADLVIGLGPGFTAGEDVHAVIETNRGHYLGRVIWKGSAEPNTNLPGEMRGVRSERVIYAPTSGIFKQTLSIGTFVQKGEMVGTIDGIPVQTSIAGVLRGLIHNSIQVHEGLKIGDVDPRNDPAFCWTVSDKALAIGGGALEAILQWQHKRGLIDRV